MKTAVSLPDDLFQRAESTAKNLRVSRSELYARALTDFLARRDRESVTTKLNEVYGDFHAELDPGLQRAQTLLLKKSEW